MYNDAGGWYLVPPYKFMSMAQCCELAFGVALLLILALAWGAVKDKMTAR